MSGTIKFADDKLWMVAGWVFRHVVRQSKPFIPPENDYLHSRLEVSADIYFYVDARDATPEDKRTLLAALIRGLEKTEAEGAESFSDPKFYPGFVERFRELIDLLSSEI